MESQTKKKDRVVSGGITASSLADPDANLREVFDESSKPMTIGPMINLNDLVTLHSDLEYQGLDSQAIRSTLKVRGAGPNEILHLLVTYMQMGNSVDSRADKRRDASALTSMKSLMNKLGVLKTAHRSDDPTLARIAIVFAPALLSLRRILHAKGKLSSGRGFNSSTPIIYQDIAFSALAYITESHRDYHFKFATVLRKAREKKDKRLDSWSDERIKEDAIRWMEVAYLGYQSDVRMQTMDPSLSAEEAIKYLLG